MSASGRGSRRGRGLGRPRCRRRRRRRRGCRGRRRRSRSRSWRGRWRRCGRRGRRRRRRRRGRWGRRRRGRRRRRRGRRRCWCRVAVDDDALDDVDLVIDPGIDRCVALGRAPGEQRADHVRAGQGRHVRHVARAVAPGVAIHVGVAARTGGVIRARRPEIEPDMGGGVRRQGAVVVVHGGVDADRRACAVRRGRGRQVEVASASPRRTPAGRRPRTGRRRWRTASRSATPPPPTAVGDEVAPAGAPSTCEDPRAPSRSPRPRGSDQDGRVVRGDRLMGPSILRPTAAYVRARTNAGTAARIARVPISGLRMV